MAGKDAAALLPPAGRRQGIFSLHDGKTFISRKNRLCGFLKKGIRQPEVFCQPPAPGFRRMKKRKTPVCLPERQRPGLFKVCKRQPEDSSVPSLWIYRYIAFSAETDKVKSARKSE